MAKRNQFLLFNPLVYLLLFLLIGCSHQDQQTNLPPRQVKVFRVGTNSAGSVTPYAGEVRARFETTLSFRVTGKILTRPVEIGDRVRKGQLLAKLDNSDFQLAVQTLKAQLKSAVADRDFAKDDLSRYRELLDKKVISNPDFDRHQTAYTNALERVVALEAQLKQTLNQLDYTQLSADRDGDITALDVEKGQVVSAGQAVVKLAQTDEKEIHFDIPEQRISEIKNHQTMAVTLLSDNDRKFNAKIREISASAERSVQVGLLAQVATNYLELRGLQKRISLQQEQIAVQREKLRAVQLFAKNGLATEADVASQKTLVETTESALPLLTSSASTLTHRISVLLGETPDKLETRLSQVIALPVTLPEIPKLLPTDLLSQRPDLRLAKTEVTAAAANLGAARADLFPKLVLSASGGFGALAVGGFSSLAESVYTLGSGLTLPLFNAGRIQAHIAAVDARLAQAALNYEKTFLLALEEVENAFVAHTASKERKKQLSDAEKSAQKAFQSTDALYQRGVKDYLSLLDARRNTLTVGDEQIKAETAMGVSIVSLYRAFGGGWNNLSTASLSKNEGMVSNKPPSSAETHQ